MRKYLTILFFVIFISFGTEFNQVLRLPLLVAHIAEHKSENKFVDLFTFLNEHYLIHHNNDDDQSEDNELPFKTINVDNFIFKVFNNNQSQISTKCPTLNKTSYSNPINDNIPKSQYIGMIWTPPKL